MTEESDRMFAVRANHFEGCSCPLIEAGYTEEDMAENDDVHNVARYFDSVIYANTDHDGGAGLVEEEVAKDAWEQIMTRLGAGRVENEYEVAQEVAENLGWQDE